MGIKSRNMRATVASGGGVVLSAIWEAYAAFTVASELPKDAESATRMIADPPIYLPWLILALCVGVLTWSLWPRKSEPELQDVPEQQPAPIMQTARTAGDGAHALSGQFGDVIINPAPVERQPVRGPIVKRIGPEPPPLKPDLPLAGLLVRVYGRLGPPPDPIDAARLAFDRKVNLEIQDAFTLHDLWVWGRYHDFATARIDQSDLRYATLDHRAGELSMGNGWGATLVYKDLKFNKAQVDSIWPVPAIPSLRTSPRIARDAPLGEALAYVVTGKWGGTYCAAVASGLGDAGAAWREARQRAHDGLLTVWGKRSPHGIHEKIPPAFWLDHQAEWFDLMRGNARTEVTTQGASGEKYVDLMVNRAEFEEEWPHGE